MSQRTILEIATSIVEEAKVLDNHFTSQGLAQPSFQQATPLRLAFQDAAVAAAHERLVSSAKELELLALGPAGLLTQILSKTQYVSAAMPVVHTFDIPQHVPLDGTISYEELAKAVGIPHSRLRLVLRAVMTDFVFQEPEPELVAHTAASRALREEPLMRAMVGMMLEELSPASVKLGKALKLHPDSEEPMQSAWALENNARLPLYEELATRHPQRAANFARVMEWYSRTIPAGIAAGVIDWAGLGKATVVDIGGGKGPVAITLASAFPNLSVIVQDLEETAASGDAQLPSEVKDRVTFMAHDFLQPQPVMAADVYYFRAVLHNWPDKYCVRMLQNLVPALKKGARVIVQDPVMREKGELSPWRAQQALTMSLNMMSYFWAHDRYADEMLELFAKADKRFRVRRVVQQDYPGWGSYEAIWEG